MNKVIDIGGPKNLYFLGLSWPPRVFFWPLTASITSEVKNDHAQATTQRILNKFIELNFSVEDMVWP